MRRIALSLLVAIGLALPVGARAIGPRSNPAYLEWQQGEPDCLYAAAAAWESAVLGIHPSLVQVFSAWWENDRQRTVDALSTFWSTHRLDGISAYLTPSGRPFRNAIVGLELSDLPPTAQWVRYGVSASGDHAVLMLARLAASVRVVSWGLEWELSYAEWRAMNPMYYAVHMSR